MPALSVPALPVSVLPEVPAGSWPAGTPSAAGRAGRSTLRTEDSDTPVAAAIAALPAPCRSSSRICAITSGVSFEARCGPLAAGTRPATPPPASALAHRHTLTGITPNACATCTCVAAFSWTSWTAASRRAASSPASHANVASPCTHTTLLPSGPLTMPTPRGYLRRVVREKRQRHLGQHPGHHPTLASGSKPFIYYCGNVAPEQAQGHRKRDKRPDQQACHTP